MRLEGRAFEACLRRALWKNVAPRPSLSRLTTCHSCSLLPKDARRTLVVCNLFWDIATCEEKLTTQPSVASPQTGPCRGIRDTLCPYTTRPSEVPLNWKTRLCGKRPFRASPRASRPSRHRDLRHRLQSHQVTCSIATFWTSSTTRPHGSDMGATTLSAIKHFKHHFGRNGKQKPATVTQSSSRLKEARTKRRSATSSICRPRYEPPSMPT